MSSDFTVISLFCGCGGLDLGFELAGFRVLWANDNNQDAIETYHLNLPQAEAICTNVQKIDPSTLPDADVLVGGYPCQGFSLGGCRRLDDPRNALYVQYSRILQAKRPPIFLAENVKGLLTMGGGEVIEQMASEFAEKGYNVQYQLFNAKNYGVPQDRERVILVGVREDLDLEFRFPAPTHGPGTLFPYETLRNAIWDMQDEPGEWYDGHYTSRYMSRQRKRSWDDVSFCIQASAEQNALHPAGEPMHHIGKDLWEFAGGTNRRLSVGECKVIQSFPREFQLMGDLKSRYKQVGNAVPPLLARAMANHIHLALERTPSAATVIPPNPQAKITDYLSTARR